MAERPILFSGPMVRAILADKKTQTRRVVSPKSFAGKWLADCERIGERGDSAFDGGLPGACEFVADPGNYPPYFPGLRLWVKETTIIAPKGFGDAFVPDAPRDKEGERRVVQYLATHPDREAANDFGCTKATPSIFMPRWAARISLDVTSVRVERLQEITAQDALAEGVPLNIPADMCRDPVAEFVNLWDRINEKRAPWDSNPFVWVISFKRTATEQQPALEVAQ